jgi:beta-lactam-binding protein with PASTA domain
VQLPPISGGNDDYAFYSQRLEMVGVAAHILRKETNVQLEDGTIIDVIFEGKSILSSIATGFKVPMGGTVDFVVSARDSEEATVPDLSCKTADQASFILQASNLVIGAINKDASVSNENTAYILKQEPAVGVKLKKGEAVSISISQKKPDGCPNE